MMSNSLVLFDIDGTLLRGAGSHHKDALREGIRRVTGQVTTFDGIDTSGQLDHDLIEALLCQPSVPGILEEIAAECQRAYSSSCSADLSGCVCRGARETLAALQEHGAVLGLVTGNLSEIGWRKMELAGIRSFFSVGAFSEDGPTRAHLARVAAARARQTQMVSEPCRISLIGDHRNDIRAAKANGFQSVAVASGVSSLEDLRVLQPDILIESLAELRVEQLL
jgi:phosphoglycolate phosphatase